MFFGARGERFGAAFWVAFDVGGAYVWFPICAAALIVPGVVFAFRFIARHIKTVAVARNFAILDRPIAAYGLDE